MSFSFLKKKLFRGSLLHRAGFKHRVRRLQPIDPHHKGSTFFNSNISNKVSI